MNRLFLLLVALSGVDAIGSVINNAVNSVVDQITSTPNPTPNPTRINCGAGHTRLSDTICGACSAGRYESGRSCHDCGANTYSSAAWTSCRNCPNGQYSGATSSGCAWCPAGKTGAGAGRGCSTCTEGKFGAGSATGCQDCAAGHIAGSNSASCAKCGAGKYKESGNKCTSCPSNASHSSDHSTCVCNEGYAGDGFTCIDKCTMDLEDELGDAFTNLKGRAAAAGKGGKISMADFGLGNMDRCSAAQVAKKSKQAMKQIVAGFVQAAQLSSEPPAIGLSVTRDTRDNQAKAAKFGGKFRIREEVPEFDVELDEVFMPEKFKGKANKLGVSKLKMMVVRTKTAAESDPAEDQCFEKDIDLAAKGLYDVMLENDGDTALACRGDKPVAKLSFDGVSVYTKKCWTGSAWDAEQPVEEGGEFTCDQQEFFVQSLGAVATGIYYAADGDTIFKTVGPDRSVWKNALGNRSAFVASTAAEAASAIALGTDDYDTSDGVWTPTDTGFSFTATADATQHTFDDVCECT